MTRQLSNQTQQQTSTTSPLSSGILQRKCVSCGQHTIAGGECGECQKKRMPLQRRAINGENISDLPPLDSYPLRKSCFHHDFSHIPVHTAALVMIQPKLTIGAVGDHYEQEADRIAEEVVQSQTIPDRRKLLSSIPKSLTSIQRQEEVLEDKLDQSVELDTEGELDLDEEEIESEDDEGLTPDETGMPKLEAGVASLKQSSPIDVPSGHGKPIDPEARYFMEQRIGFNFSKVRIHDDAEAVASAKRLHAHAYTIRSDIYFNQDKYNPKTTEGLKLLAHELTHVVQQTGLPQSSSSRNTLVQRQNQTRRRRRSPTDAPNRERARRRIRCGSQTCNGQCTSSRNQFVHHPICGNEICGPSGASNTSNFIRHIDVSLTTQEVKLEWGNLTRSNRVEGGILSSPNPSATPQGSFSVGQKCGSCHTNQSGDGMAWFTGFHNHLQFGFHNSQQVARGVRSHGCVRIPCATARRIHDNTASGTTTVCIHTGGGWGCEHQPPTARRSSSEGSGSRGGSAGQELLPVSSNEFSLTSEIGDGEEDANT